MSDFRLVQNGYYQIKDNSEYPDLSFPLKLVGYKDEYSHEENKVLKLCHFKPAFRVPHTDDVKLWIHEVEPITLTKDWLIRLDFKPWREHTYKRGGFIIVSFKTETIVDDTRFTYHMTELKYVHQLQNMYFAVNYSELKYKV